MPKSAIPTDYLVPYSVVKANGVNILNFRMSQDDNGYYSYESIKDFPDVVEYDGLLFRRTGWDSDHGIVIYKETTKSKVAIKRH